MNKKRVFIDTSIIIAAILSKNGGSFYIFTQLHKNYQFIINKFVLTETETVIEKKFSGDNEMYKTLFLLLSISSTKIVSNPKKKDLKKAKSISKKDRPILISAVNQANYLITLDKEFLNAAVSKFAKNKGTQIFRPKGFIEQTKA